MVKYDPNRLDELGRRRAELRTQLAEVNAEIDIEIPKATKAGIIQAEIARRTGLTREAVVQKMRPRDERWKRGAKT